MRRLPIVQVVLISILACNLWASDDAIPGIKLLPGYRAKRGRAVDATVWTIERDGGPGIHFEAGPSEGSINPTEQGIYAWYREQTISGFKVRLAFIKPGLKTRFEPENRRGMKPGGVLVVTFMLDKEHPDHTANFTAKVANVEEMADVLLMVLTFNPSEGVY